MSTLDTRSVDSSQGDSTSQRPKKFKCDIKGCLKTYSKPSLLDQHKRSHTNERPFMCSVPDCNKSFLRKSHLQAHLVSHENQNNKPYHCSICGKGVNTQQHLRRHEVTHTKSFVCTHDGCNESFYKHQSLRHHVLSVHENKLTCKTCGKIFSRPYRLAQHTIKFHSDSPVYQCDTQGCFRNFKTWSALQLHVKTDHPKSKCPICGKGCVGKNGLKSHMLVHDDEKTIKLWNCKYCDIGKFPKKIDLINHYNEYHDRNIPDELLSSGEREYLEQLLANTTGPILEKSNEFDDTYIEDVDGEENGSELVSTQSQKKSLDNFNENLKNGKSIVDLISNNYDKRKIDCPKNNCYRKFSRPYDLERHLRWHKSHLSKVETFLETLRRQESSDKIFEGYVDSNIKTLEHPFDQTNATNENDRDDNDNNDDDMDLNTLIDSELISLRAGDF